MGAEFIAEEGILKGLILSLERGEEWTIGRDPDLSEIVIEDSKVSRRHMRIRKTEEGYFVENLSETNPVMVDEVPITVPTLLHEGASLRIGDSLFRFHAEGVPFNYGFASDSEESHDDIAETPHSSLNEEDQFHETPIGTEDTFEAFKEEPFQDEIKDESFRQDIPEEENFFDEGEVPELQVDLTQTTRFILKVISGPNTGAEFALDFDRAYLIGTDTATCDIVFNDLSVSREHARLSVGKEGRISIQDLGSRNGVIVDKERIAGTKFLESNAVIALGTSAFLLIDRESPAETIAAPLYELPSEEEVEEKGEQEKEEALIQEEPVAAKIPPKAPLPIGTFILALIICGFAILLGIGMVSLLQTEEVEVAQKDHLVELNTITNKYPAVRFTYNKGSGKLFLMGHIRTGIEHNELLYQLRGLCFIKGTDDNIVNDEAVWQEMNILLSKHPEFKGVSMHSPEAGVFVIGGYLKDEQQATDLSDYLNINFNYLTNLQNRVVVEQSIAEEIGTRLMQQGFGGVNTDFMNGELQLKGYISSTEVFAFDKLVEDFKKIPGVRMVRNHVVSVTPEQGVIDLNKKYQNKALSLPRYRVTGYSKHGDININVVINGRIISRGDCLDGYTVTGIQPHTVFLEKDGLKYKIEYNKCKSFGVEDSGHVWDGER